MKQEVSFKGNLEQKTVVSYLEDMIKSFKAGKVCIQNGEKFVTLQPQGDIELSVQASEKKGKEKLSFELSWRKSPEDERKSIELKISSKEPVKPKPAAKTTPKPAQKSTPKPAEATKKATTAKEEAKKTSSPVKKTTAKVPATVKPLAKPAAKVVEPKGTTASVKPSATPSATKPKV